jgi:tRNA C32,U32 (ribose-2'-O)-methylase TrmJ
VLYELRDVSVDETQLPDTVERASEPELEGLYEELDRFLASINHPVEKREKTMRLWRRVLGRAHPTGREASTMRGLFRRASGLLEHPERLHNEE